MRRALLTLLVVLSSAALVGPTCLGGQTSARGRTCEDAPDGSPCDDGRACTSNDLCLRAACVGTPIDEDCALKLTPALCFTARAATAPAGEAPYPTFEPRLGETLIDEFSTRLPADSHQIDVRRSIAFCSDASGAALQTGDHLHGYGIKPAKTQPPQPTFHGAILEIENELGVATLALGRSDRLLVPAGAVAGLGSAAGSPRDPALRAKCYAVVGEARRSGSPLPATVLVLPDTLHGVDRELHLGGPSRLCTHELGRLGAIPTPRPGYVACYDVVRARPRPPSPMAQTRSGAPKERPPPDPNAAALLVSVRDEFGAAVLEARKPDEVCLPTVLHRPDPAALDGPFSFLVEAGPVNEALRAIWARGFEAPQTVEAANEAAAVTDVAERVLEAHRAEAGATLLANLQLLDPDDLESFLSLHSLVRLLADEAILAFLHDLVATPPPPLLRDGDDETHPNHYVRHLAASQIAAAARGGSPAAWALLPELAAGPDPGAAAIAVRTYLALSTDRRLAQRALGERMPPANRHLLYTD